MSNSALISETVLAHSNNYWGDRKGAKINKIIVHHMAAVWTGKRCAQSFQNPKRGASANYCIGYNGEIVLCVPENLCAGTTGGFEIDRYAVTIEVANSKMGEPWAVSDKTLDSLIKLCADIANRNSLGELVKGKNLCWHRMYAATACPGTYLLSKMDYIASMANDLNADRKGSDGYYKGFNVGRGENDLCVYVNPLKKAPTNKYGWEAAVDRYQVVVSGPEYWKGGLKIPEGGRVISGHGTAGDFVKQLRAGYLVWIEGGRVYFSSRQHRGVNKVNGGRGTNCLCVYDSGKTTGTNKWGAEVQIINGKAAAAPVYGQGSMAIPSGGFVLSGHGEAAWWMMQYISKGTKVIFDGKTVTLE